MAGTLAALGVDRGCMLAFHDADRNVYLSARNIPNIDVRLVEELTAYEVLRRRKLVFSRPALERMLNQRSAPSAKGGE
jgi:ribosomal protein L4